MHLLIFDVCAFCRLIRSYRKMYKQKKIEKIPLSSTECPSFSHCWELNVAQDLPSPNLNYLNSAFLMWYISHFFNGHLSLHQPVSSVVPFWLLGWINPSAIIQQSGTDGKGIPDHSEEPFAGTVFNKVSSLGKVFRKKSHFFFPLRDPKRKSSGFSTVKLLSNFFFFSVLTDWRKRTRS